MIVVDSSVWGAAPLQQHARQRETRARHQRRGAEALLQLLGHEQVPLGVGETSHRGGEGAEIPIGGGQAGLQKDSDRQLAGVRQQDLIEPRGAFRIAEEHACLGQAMQRRRAAISVRQGDA